jgi:hypothetical protein
MESWNHYNLLDTARYLVCRACAIIFPVLLFTKSIEVTPTDFPALSILTSISNSSYKKKEKLISNWEF